MSTLTEAAAACCACLRVHWTETKHPGGEVSGRWLCTQCGNEFESRTVASWADGGGGPGECAAPSEHRCKAEGCRRRLAPWCAEHRDDVVMRADYEALRADLETAAAVTKQLQAELEAERHMGEVSQAEYSQAVTHATARIKELQGQLDEDRRIAKEEIGKRDDWNVELLGVIRLAMDTAEHAQLNNKALTGGDDRRLAALIAACRAELQEDPA